MEAGQAENPKWREERLCYQVLRAVYERAGGDCTATTTGAVLQSDLPIDADDLFRILRLLEEHRYLFRVGPGPELCITPKGIRYIEWAAGRRQTLRIGQAE
jgi:hypothetical protein